MFYEQYNDEDQNGNEYRIKKIVTNIAPNPFENIILSPFTTGTISGYLEIGVKYRQM